MQNLHLQSDAAFENPGYKLFSAGQIAAGTFFGSILTGGYMLASNYSNLGEKSKARRTTVLSICGFVLLLIGTMGLFDEMSEHSSRRMMHMLNLVIAIGFLWLIKKLQGIEYTNHIAEGGERVSNWKVAAVVVVISVLYSAIVVPLSMGL